MAQANSVQREPSMEEILASIRRIIEDSDTARPANDGAVAETAAPSEPAEVADIETMRLGVREAASQPRPAPQIDHAAIEQASLLRDRRIAEELRPSLAAVPLSARVAAEPAAVAPSPAAPAAEPVASEPTSASAEPAIQQDPMLTFEDLLEDEMNAAPEAAPVSPLPSIISDRTGRQVAAAFGELSEAFAATRQKSFDEMAEAMLRPMLTDWLDNNLPTLVERLVREEIERIARGPAR
ncbi:PopZ family protein [Tianweitania populi]